MTMPISICYLSLSSCTFTTRLTSIHFFLLCILFLPAFHSVHSSPTVATPPRQIQKNQHHHLANRTFLQLTAFHINTSTATATSPDGRIQVSLASTLYAQRCSLDSSAHSSQEQPPTAVPASSSAQIKQNNRVTTTVYVIDTGCRASHEELRGRTETYAAPGSPYMDGVDDHGHGTHVATRIGGKNFGLVPYGRIICIKALSHLNEGSSKHVVSAINLAIELHMSFVRNYRHLPHIAVMCISLGVAAPLKYKDLDKTVTKAGNLGIIPVVAAGNAGRDACAFTPARAKGAITVAATTTMLVPSDELKNETSVKRRMDSNDDVVLAKLARFSNRGQCVSVAAPGVKIWSAVGSGDNHYGVSSGTSMAAPFVAGIVALIMRIEHKHAVHRSTITTDQVVTELKSMGHVIKGGLNVISVDGFCRWIQEFDSRRREGKHEEERDNDKLIFRTRRRWMTLKGKRVY